MSSQNQFDASGNIGQREKFIPVRKSDILRALIADGAIADPGEQEKFRQFCRLIGSLLHYEYFERLETLRNDYYYFNPDVAEPAHLEPKGLEDTRAEFLDTLVDVLRSANFVEVARTEVEAAHDERHVLTVQIETEMDEYRDVRIFRRGHTAADVKVPIWFGWRSTMVSTVVYDQIVLVMLVKPDDEISSPRMRERLARRHTRPGSILLKCFRNIERPDVNMLFPNVRVVMSPLDKLMLGVPAVVGIIPIFLNLLPTITVLFLVIGFYLGFSGAVGDDDLKKALAALSALFALGGFALRQWMKYQRQSLMYHKEISDKVYFRNINNNTGVFDYVIGAAEEQDFKEAALAYYFLLTTSSPMTAVTLDERIEQWLTRTFSIDIEFEVTDALIKLERFGLVESDGTLFSARPLDDALVALDRHWDNLFRFANPAT